MLDGAVLSRVTGREKEFHFVASRYISVSRDENSAKPFQEFAVH
jgi:hypothetical protein